MGLWKVLLGYSSLHTPHGSWHHESLKLEEMKVQSCGTRRSLHGNIFCFFLQIFERIIWNNFQKHHVESRGEPNIFKENIFKDGILSYIFKAELTTDWLDVCHVLHTCNLSSVHSCALEVIIFKQVNQTSKTDLLYVMMRVIMSVSTVYFK